MKNLQELNGQPAEPLMIIGPMLNLKEVVRYRDETYTYESSIQWLPESHRLRIGMWKTKKGKSHFWLFFLWFNISKMTIMWTYSPLR
jgi:hypothetical protein